VFCAGADGNGREEALGELLRRYLPALKAHLLCHKRLDPDAAEDLLQGFVADKIVERNLLGRVTGGKGKFRTFLQTVLDRYVVSELRKQGAKCRSPQHLTQVGEDDWLLDGKAANNAPDPFDLQWGREVIAEALTRMRAECEVSGRQDVWGVFECRVLAPTLEGAPPAPYETLVGRFGFPSPGQASNVLVTAKRMFARILRSAVAEYQGEEGVEQEIRDLKQTLSRTCA